MKWKITCFSVFLIFWIGTPIVKGQTIIYVYENTPSSETLYTWGVSAFTSYELLVLEDSANFLLDGVGPGVETVLTVATTTIPLTFNTPADYENPTDVSTLLTAGDSSYQFHVRYRPREGGEPQQTTFWVFVRDMEVPEVPADITEIQMGTNPIVGWTASPNTLPETHEGNAIIGYAQASLITYNVEYRATGESDWISLASSSNTQVTLSNLQIGIRYKVRVQAQNSEGVSEWAMIEIGAVSPNQVTFVSVTSNPTDPNTRLDVSWDAPLGGVSAITDYDIQYRVKDTGAYSDAGYDGLVLMHTLTGLNPGTPYQVQVRARTSAGPGEWSPPGEGTTGDPPPPPTGDPPPPPPEKGLSAPIVQQYAKNPSSSLHVQWTSPAEQNSPVTDYDVQYKMKSKSTWREQPHEGTETTTILLHLNPGITYQVQVRATKENGVTTPWSPPGEGTTRAKQRVKIFACPVGWQRQDSFGTLTKRVLIHAVKLEVDINALPGIYKVIAIEIYADPDENLSDLEGWKLTLAKLYNYGMDYGLTAENSAFDENGFTQIESPADTPFPITELSFLGQWLPGFDYRLFDTEGRRVDFGISCYKQGGLTPRLWTMETPRVERLLEIEHLDWEAIYYRSEWSVPGAVAAGAPSAVRKNAVTSWAALKRGILKDR